MQLNSMPKSVACNLCRVTALSTALLAATQAELASASFNLPFELFKMSQLHMSNSSQLVSYAKRAVEV